MELVYPLAKRVETAFDTNNKTEIEALTKMRARPYGALDKIADGTLKLPFDITEDGFYGMYNVKEDNEGDEEGEKENDHESLGGVGARDSKPAVTGNSLKKARKGTRSLPETDVMEDG